MEHQKQNQERQENNKEISFYINVEYHWNAQYGYYTAAIEVALPTEEDNDHLHHLFCGTLGESLLGYKWLGTSISWRKKDDYRGKKGKTMRIFSNAYSPMKLNDNPIGSALMVEELVTSIKANLFKLVKYNKEKLDKMPEPLGIEVKFV